MIQNMRRFGLFCLLLASGCSSLFGSRGLPPDPLFADRKPVEAKSQAGPPLDMPISAPTAPANPYLPDPRFTASK